jgi:hypothetical protein
VRFSFTRITVGRRVGGRCVAETHTNRGRPHCPRKIFDGTLTVAAHPGTNKVSFAGRVSHTNKLSPGNYTLTLMATSVTGQRSKIATLTFVIVK